MSKKKLSILLLIIMAICFAGMAYYPIQYFYQKGSNEDDMEALRKLRRSALDNSADPTQSDDVIQETLHPSQEPELAADTTDQHLSFTPAPQATDVQKDAVSKEAAPQDNPDTTIEPTHQAIEPTMAPETDLTEKTVQPTDAPESTAADQHWQVQAYRPGKEDGRTESGYDSARVQGYL